MRGRGFECPAQRWLGKTAEPPQGPFLLSGSRRYRPPTTGADTWCNDWSPNEALVSWATLPPKSLMDPPPQWPTLPPPLTICPVPHLRFNTIVRTLHHRRPRPGRSAPWLSGTLSHLSCSPELSAPRQLRPPHTTRTRSSGTPAYAPPSSPPRPHGRPPPAGPRRCPSISTTASASGWVMVRSHKVGCALTAEVAVLAAKLMGKAHGIHLFRGRRIVTVEPCPSSSLVAIIVPP